MKKRLYLAIINTYWWLEHRRPFLSYGYRKRKQWEHRYCEKFQENIYGQPFAPQPTKPQEDKL